MKDLNLSRTLIQSGLTWKEVKERTGITQTLYYQIKRELKPKDFGCVVCGAKKSGHGFCRHHLWRYVYYPEYVRKLKAA